MLLGAEGFGLPSAMRRGPLFIIGWGMKDEEMLHIAESFGFTLVRSVEALCA
jgi:hypothetical protein